MAIPSMTLSGGRGAGGYQNLLANAQSQYAGIMQGYQQAMAGQQARYDRLGANVQKTIQGVDASQRQAIKDSYAQQSGALDQQMINSGLGNTTVRGSMHRGLLLDNQKANIALSNQMAQLRAGYQSQIGMAGLGARGQLQHQQLGYQGNWQAHQLSAGMQGAGLDAQAAGRGGYGGGGGSGGGLSSGSGMEPYSRYRDQLPSYGHDPYVPWGTGGYAAPSYAGGDYGGDDMQGWYDQALGAAGYDEMQPMYDQALGAAGYYE